MKIKISPNGQFARLGDGCTLLASRGEIDVKLTRNKWTVRLQAIVVDKLNSDCYGGMTFLKENDIQTRPSTGEIKIHAKYTVYQTNTVMTPPQLKSIKQLHFSVDLPEKTIFPKVLSFYSQTPETKHENESIVEVPVPHELKNDDYVIVEPSSQVNTTNWPVPQLCSISDAHVILKNKTTKPLSFPNDVPSLLMSKVDFLPMSQLSKGFGKELEAECQVNSVDISETAVENAKKIDLTRAPKHLQKQLYQAHLQYADVFAPDLSVGYNGKLGPHVVKLRFADDNRPQMSKCHIPRWAGKDDKMKQLKMDDLERQGVLIDPYKANIPIKLISPSFLRVKARAKGKNINDCTTSEIRWIISPCQLNPYLRQLHVNNVSKEDMFVFKSEKKYCIEFDCYEGYFQNHIDKEDWSYLAVETPFKGLRVLTRSGQGLLNQEIELGQLLVKVLGPEIEKGHVIVQADDGQVGGSTMEEAVTNWISVLRLLSNNNIKLNPSKISIFPETSLIHGWEFKDGYVQPSTHRQLAIAEVNQPTTVGELRTYMGVYKTFFPAMEGLSNIMDPFDKMCAGKDSKEKLKWNEETTSYFKNSQKLAKTNIKKTSAPWPS